MNGIDRILKDKKHLCVFVGAGASILSPTSLPSFYQLNRELIYRLSERADLSPQMTEELAKIRTKPEQLLQIIWDYSHGEINPVAGFRYAQPNKNHALISRLAREGVRCIVTTNFDSCIETEMRAQKIPFLLYYDTSKNSDMHRQIIKSLNRGKRIIWKPHGDCGDTKSLCYSKRNVARLKNSLVMNSTMRFIVENYNILFLGYSGYDDDLFPIIFDSFRNSEKSIIWNTHNVPPVDSPVSFLRKIDPDRVHLYTGDMLPMLEKTVDRIIQPRTTAVASVNSFWIDAVYSQIRNYKKSFSVAILSKFSHTMGHINSAEDMWRYGLSYPDNDIREEDDLRFRFNLGILSDNEAYRICMKKGYYQIAEVALQRVVEKQKINKNYPSYLECVEQYGQNSNNTELSQYFPKAIYLMLKYDIYIFLQNGCFSPEEEVHHKKVLKKTYDALIDSGFLSEACLLTARYCNHITSLHFSDEETLNTALSQYNAIQSYGENIHLCEIAYVIANVAIAQGNTELAECFNRRSFELLDNYYFQGGCDKEYYYRIKSYLYQQESMLLPSGVDSCLKGLSCAEKLTIDSDKMYCQCILYATLASCYRFSNWSLCQKYGKISCDLAVKTNNMTEQARVLLYMGESDVAHGKRADAVAKFRTSYKLYLKTGENTKLLIDAIRLAHIPMDIIDIPIQ